MSWQKHRGRKEGRKESFSKTDHCISGFRVQIRRRFIFTLYSTVFLILIWRHASLAGHAFLLQYVFPPIPVSSRWHFYRIQSANREGGVVNAQLRECYQSRQALSQGLIQASNTSNKQSFLTTEWPDPSV